MQRKEPRILLDAEVLVKLAYLTISEDVDLKNLETLRLTYEQDGETAGEGVLEGSLEITPLEELRRLCEQALASGDMVEE
ncbi:MAG: hypothetical protein QXR97_05900 [Thermoproteota archaeon]